VRALLILSVLPCFLFIACEPEQEKITFDSGASLRLSADTILFDTLFTSQRSITKRFRVYNDNKNAVNISSIDIDGGTQSAFKIFVNGFKGSSFEDVTLLGEDSLLVLVEATIDPMDEDTPFIVEDQITFVTNENVQNVKLVAWGQDAVFLNGEILDCSATWTADRPYVIFNSVLVDSLCNLNVEAGARIYSHNGSFLLVQGSIDVMGTADEKVLFSNDRFDEGFVNAPGQWGGIIFLEGSNDNYIVHADIRNAEFGVYLGTPDDDNIPDLTLGNVRIENIGGSELFAGNIINAQPGYGILAISSDLYAYNTIINNCAINTVGNFAGGNYRYEHCTFANFSFDFFRNDPSVVFADNLQLENESLLVSDLNLEMTNSIIWGSLNEEVVLGSSGEAGFNLNITNSIIRTQQEINGENINNTDPLFVNPREYNYSLDTLSPAKDSGVDLGIIEDYEGKDRDAQPDLGALERKEN